MVSLKEAFVHCGVLLLLCQSVTSSPVGFGTGDGLTDLGLRTRADDDDPYLRIMPLGASITKGTNAPDDTDKNGYRKPLRDLLRSQNYKVNMVGSQPYGNMSDSDTEGYPGKVISEVQELSKKALSANKPNIILINAGTNDALQDKFVNLAGNRMEKLVLECFTQSPKAAIALSTLIPNGDSDVSDRSRTINSQIRSLVEKLRRQELHVVLAEMDDGFLVAGDEKGDLNPADQTHPTLQGFRKMASVWRYAIGEIEKEGWIQPPDENVAFKDDAVGGSECQKQQGSGNSDARGKTQVLTAGSSLIKDDGKYRHKSEKMDHFSGVTSGDLFFAQLVNNGAPRGKALDEIIMVNGDAGDINIYVNEGDGNFGWKKGINVHDKCKSRGIHWGDVNNDGFDDFLCIAEDGTTYASINKGGEDGKIPEFGDPFEWSKAVEGFGQANVRLGDIDGDGRLDYCVLHGDGNMDCWRNGGLKDKPAYWQDMGAGQPVFEGKGMGDIEGVRLVDINGDGRTDWLWVNDWGKVTTYINQRGESKSMRPYWLVADGKDGVTHQGFKKGDENGVDNDGKPGRDRVFFGRMYGSGRADYALKQHYNDGRDWIYPWKNDGEGGTRQKGDGAHWGDMTGSGNDDYVWIYSYGAVVIFRNNNEPPSTDAYESSGWEDKGIVLETKMDRRTLHIGDWDGDGKADVIGVEQDTGTLHIWITQYDSDKDEFTFREPISLPTGNFCKDNMGVGLFDHGPFFADLTGDGTVDYLCMQPDGTTNGLLNRKGKSGLEDIWQVKFSEDKDRANFRFADADGDGRADLLWVDKFTGDTTVWHNDGELDEDDRIKGSKFRWVNQGVLYQGSSRGPNMHFPNLGGEGRADMVQVSPDGKGWCWFNSCPRGGDDDEIVKLPLPEYKPGDPVESDPGEDGADKFCGARDTGSWNPELWRELGMGDWFMTTSRYYVQNGWPQPDQQEGGVPRAITNFDLNVEDGDLEWDGRRCRSIDQECIIVRDALVPGKDNSCRQNWQRSFATWTMGGFAAWLQRFQVTMDEVTNSEDFNLIKITNSFIADRKESLTLDASSQITMALGFIGALTAMTPVAAHGAVVANSLVVASVYAKEPAAPVRDDRFTTFGDVSEHFGELRDSALESAANLFTRLFAENPKDGDEEAGTELARLIESGEFANQDISTGSEEPDKQLMRKMIRAPVISEVWNNQQVFIVKWRKGAFHFEGSHDFRYDPCSNVAGPDNTWDEDWRDQVYCSDDSNYVMFSYYREKDWFFHKGYGTNDDDLDHWGYNLGDVVKGADRVQQKSGKFKSNDHNVMSDILGEMADDPEGPLEKAYFFNVPVCDLTDMDFVYTDSYCFSEDNQRGFERCLQAVIMDTCETFKLGSNRWPYDNPKPYPDPSD